MSEVHQILDAVRAAGGVIKSNGTNLAISPASKIPGDLKARLRDHKAEIIQYLDLETRLDAAGICIAIDKATGAALLLLTESDVTAVRNMAAVHKPFEVQLTPAQRRELAADLGSYERLLADHSNQAKKQ